MAFKIKGNENFIKKVKEIINLNHDGDSELIVTQSDGDAIEIILSEENLSNLKEVTQTLFKSSTTLEGKTSRGKVWLSANDVHIIEAYKNDVETTLKGQSILLDMKLYEYEALLKDEGFIRIGKSTLINANKIVSVAAAYNGKLLLYLDNHQKVYVNRSYTKQFKNWLTQRKETL